MIKIKQAYPMNIDEQKPIVSKPTNLSDGDSATELGNRGISSIEFDHEYNEKPTAIEHKDNPEDYSTEDNFKELLLELGDELDKSDDIILANFADFLLRKIGESKEINYTTAFNQLILKINEADLVDTNETVKKLTKIYSRTIVLEYMKNNNLNKAKESAYQKALHRADQYLSD